MSDRLDDIKVGLLRDGRTPKDEMDWLVDEVERLRHEVDVLAATAATLDEENGRLSRAVQAVRDLHVPATDEMSDLCEECFDSVWPCGTLAALDAALGGERDE